MYQNIGLFWIIAAFSSILMLFYILKKRPRIESPIVFTFLLYFTYFIISPALNIIWKIHQIPVHNIYNYYFTTEFIFLLGVVSLITGYTLTMRKEGLSNKISNAPHLKVLLINAFLWEFIGVFGYFIWTRQLGVSLFVINPLKLSNYYLKLGETSKKASGYLALSILFLVPATLMLTELAIRKVYRTTAMFLVFVNFILFLTRGVRYIVLIAGGSLLFYYIKRRNIKVKKTYIFLSLLTFLILFALIAYLRGAPSLKNISFNSDFILAFLVSSVSLFEPTASFVYYIPRFHPYFLGESFWYVFILPIPRLLWHQKPYPQYLKVLWKITGGRYFGYAVPNIGEYYANFGIPGVVVFMFLLGLFFAVIYNIYRKNDKNILVLMSYSIFYFFIFQIISRGYFPQVFVQFLYLVLPIMSLYVSDKLYLNGSRA